MEAAIELPSLTFYICSFFARKHHHQQRIVTARAWSSASVTNAADSISFVAATGITQPPTISFFLHRCSPANTFVAAPPLPLSLRDPNFSSLPLLPASPSPWRPPPPASLLMICYGRRNKEIENVMGWGGRETNFMKWGRERNSLTIKMKNKS